MNRYGSVLLALLAFSGSASATNVSTADPTYPAAFDDVDAGPLREQFNKIINDIDNLWLAIGPNFLEANQILGAVVSGKATGVPIPSCFGPSNGLTWAQGVGFGCNDIQVSGGQGGTA